MRIRKSESFRLVKIILFAAFITLILVSPSTAQDSLIILNSSDVPTMLRNIKYIESLGGTIYHRFPPHILIGDIPASQHGDLTGRMNITEIATNAVVSKVTGYGRTAEIAINAWNNNYMGKAVEKDLVPIPVPEPGPIKGDVLIIPENTKTKRGAGMTRHADNLINEASIQPYMAGFYDTSEYMIGYNIFRKQWVDRSR